MAIRIIESLCKRCYHKDEHVIDYPQEWDKEWECSQCGSPSFRTISAPSIRTSDSASFVDGTDRGSEFNKLKLAAKLKVEASSLPHDKRDEIKKEIKKLGAGTDDL